MLVNDPVHHNNRNINFGGISLSQQNNTYTDLPEKKDTKYETYYFEITVNLLKACCRENDNK